MTTVPTIKHAYEQDQGDLYAERGEGVHTSNLTEAAGFVLSLPETRGSRPGGVVRSCGAAVTVSSIWCYA